jgi:hypothetical protein
MLDSDINNEYDWNACGCPCVSFQMEDDSDQLIG